MPARDKSQDPEGGIVRRHHVHGECYSRAVAVVKALIDKKAGTHLLRHAFATDLLEGGMDTWTRQELPGPADAKKTATCADVAKQKGAAPFRGAAPWERLVRLICRRP